MKVKLKKYNAEIVQPTFDFGNSVLYFDERLIQLVQECQEPVCFSNPYRELFQVIIYFQENTFVKIKFESDADRKLFLKEVLNK